MGCDIMTFIEFNKLYEINALRYQNPSNKIIFNRFTDWTPRKENDYDVVVWGWCGAVNKLNNRGNPYNSQMRITTVDDKLVKLLLSGRIREFVEEQEAGIKAINQNALQNILYELY